MDTSRDRDTYESENPYISNNQLYSPYSSPGGTGGNPYGGTFNQTPAPPPPVAHQDSNYSQPSQYSQYSSTHEPLPQTTSTPLSQQDFLTRVNGTKSRIRQLSSNIQEIGSIHQRLLASPESDASRALESLVTQTQVRNTQIKDEIKFLERDAARDPSNTAKRTQVEALKRSFRSQLDDFYREEADYSRRYREAISRQYRIVNPEATEEEVQEAANADWGEEGIFTQALKSNRTGQASSVLGAVRARHNDIQAIEKTMAELSQLFQQLDEQVVYQEVQVDETEQQTHQVVDDHRHANEQLDRGIASAKRARKLKWWCLFTVVAIICILALILGLYFGLRNNGNNNRSNNRNTTGQ
ncbi:t-SNARE [Sporormia fimetaria CBS 119925]|uniref:t-SNARE n=1 Tax=Sporormia fimetaria CBS 119925 TaxID=1340428 RepID=A0A6A6VIF7_9PLEO|nr:t-SNARE [Sporormia fimetaria CBS 119925]